MGNRQRKLGLVNIFEFRGVSCLLVLWLLWFPATLHLCLKDTLLFLFPQIFFLFFHSPLPLFPQLYTSPAYPPPRLEDTLGAGDTFNAGFIHKLSTGHPVSTALTFACQLAGAKCGMSGFEGLATDFMFRNCSA